MEVGHFDPIDGIATVSCSLGLRMLQREALGLAASGRRRLWARLKAAKEHDQDDDQYEDEDEYWIMRLADIRSTG